MNFQLVPPLGAALILLVACTSVPTTIDGPCSIGKICSLVGKARIYPAADGEQAWLELDKNCVALALPDDVYANVERWNRRYVSVVGIAYLQPKGTSLLYYEIKGRRISAGVCEGGPLIIVDGISLRPNE